MSKTEDEDIICWIRENVKCCSCGHSLKNSKYINGISLNKIATWKHPSWGNLYVKGSHGRAISFQCDSCLNEKKTINYAVEFKDKNVIYHPVEKLEDTFEITEDMLYGHGLVVPDEKK